MAFPRVRFNVPPRPPRTPQTRVDIFEPVLGLNEAQPAVDLQPGETPRSQNFVVEDSFLRPRSGLSLFGSSNSLGDNTGMLAAEHVDVEGNVFPVAASTQTVIVFGLDGSASWSTLSYVLRSSGFPADNLSGNSLNIMRSASVYEPVRDENWFVFSNGINTPKVWQPSQTTFSDLSDFISVESRGAIPYALDDRLCFFNCGTSGVTFATRVRWSERGATSNFSTTGAGFQDLMDMRGVGTAAVKREFDALLFTDSEIWIQRPRRDNFAFDFAALSRSDGCPYPKTVANTPAGVVFLNREFDVKVVQGSAVRSVGKNVRQKLRDEISSAQHAFGLYNSRHHRYELYYMTAADISRPGHRLDLDIDTGKYLVQILTSEVGAGIEAQQSQAGNVFFIDEVSDTIDSVSQQINNMVRSSTLDVDKSVVVVSSDGTAYRFRDEQGTDDGSTITAQWDSHALSGRDPTRLSSLYDLYIDYEADSDSNIDLLLRSSPDAPYGQSSNFTFNASDGGNTEKRPVFITGRHPQFRFQSTDGMRPKLARISAKLRDAGQE